MSTALIALGGNLGDVRSSFDSACSELSASCTIISKSKLYLTSPIGPLMNSKPQPDYLNAVIKVGTSLTADDLLQMLHNIEAHHDRERVVHWGARTLDMDLLAYDDLISDALTLTLPHPRIAERLFVLQPLSDIEPDWIHPVTKRKVSTMIQSLINTETNLFQGMAWTSLQ